MSEPQQSKKQLAHGRKMAREIYDWDLKDLMSITMDDKDRLQKKYSGLSSMQVDDVINQVIEARKLEIQRVGWQALPHDLTVIVTVILTAFFGWRVGIVGYVASLILFESIAQFYFSANLYKPLSLIVWLTYPAYLVFAYFLYQQDVVIWQIVLATVFLWAGTFFLGSLARLPSRAIIQNLQQSRAAVAQRKHDQSKSAD
jgi:hypothetical protein